MYANGYPDDMSPAPDNSNKDPDPDPDLDPEAPGAFVDDEDADEVPEPNEPA